MPHYRKSLFTSLRKFMLDNHIQNNKRWKDGGVTDNKREYFKKKQELKKCI